MRNTIAVYPGSFDPVTHGHLDIIRRGSRIFEKVVVAILRNPSKQPTFPLRTRIRLLGESVAEMENVEVEK